MGQLQESVVPFLFHRRQAAKVDKAMKKVSVAQKVEFYNGDVSEELQKQTSVESIMDVYDVSLIQSTVFIPTLDTTTKFAIMTI